MAKVAKNWYTAEEIIHLLREAEVQLGQGMSIAVALPRRGACSVGAAARSSRP